MALDRRVIQRACHAPGKWQIALDAMLRAFLEGRSVPIVSASAAEAHRVLDDLQKVFVRLGTAPVSVTLTFRCLPPPWPPRDRPTSERPGRRRPLAFAVSSVITVVQRGSKPQKARNLTRCHKQRGSQVG